MNDNDTSSTAVGVAIVGMAGRFPGAANVEQFWQNVRNGVESISRFSVEELEIADASQRAKHADYVRARPIIADADQFDAAFFGILPREAEHIDPQQRVFLECCWEALEDAGYDPKNYAGAISVFAGCSANTYFLRNVCSSRKFIEEYTGAYQVGNYTTLLGTNNDFLATRVSYKLDLKGPAFTIQAGCSTSLLAICQACQSLLSYQADMALAGGVSITFPQKRGYLYQEGGMVSPDGRCRPFDANAQGTVFGSGSAVVLLKRLDEAVSDGDHIYAVIRGFAMNNDGANKIGYTAPSVDGQAEVITMAHEIAGVHPETIGYVEAHGTATPLGDPIEFAALTRAFSARSKAKNYCALGAAKANVGHLDIAAGATGLINAVHALVHKELPALLHFKAPNPRIDLENSPFYVNTERSEWKRGNAPRRAGVSAFGVGGTNAHVVLEEAPEIARAVGGDTPQLLLLSARSEAALETATANLARHLRTHPEFNMGDVAYTLQVGRRGFDHRRAFVCSDRESGVEALEGRGSRKPRTGVHDGREPSVVFMFPGQGAQSVNMGADLYRHDEAFRDDIDTCAQILTTHLGLDLRTIIYPDESHAEAAQHKLRNTGIAQPALFTIGYALARLWMRWGVHPQAMIGHSVGEFVAACLAGVFSLEDGLAIVATRARLMQELPSGTMLSVRLAEHDVTPYLNEELSIAAVNSPSLCVVSGPDEAINRLQKHLDEQGKGSRRLATSHAFHSAMMDPIVRPFTDHLKQFHFRPPTIPYISCVSGTWVKNEEATDPAYWAGHVRQPVQFSKGIASLQSAPGRIFLEVGPGQTLCALARQHRNGDAQPGAVASLADGSSDTLNMLQAVGSLWMHGVTPDWNALHGQSRLRCSLPTYPFERTRFWIEPPQSTPSRDVPAAVPTQTQPSFENPMTEAKATNPTLPSRHDRIRTKLIELIEDLSGLTLADADLSATFLEMGFDSLFLTMVTLELQSTFDLKIAFRQLLDQESTLGALAAYIDSRLPADAPQWTAVADTSNTETTLTAPMPGNHIAPNVGTEADPNGMALPSLNGSSSIEIIIREQLQAMSQLMSRQLEMIRGDTACPSPNTVNGLGAIPAPPKEPGLQTPADKLLPSSKSSPEFKAFGPYKPPSTGTGNERDWTEQQREYLRSFIERYCRRTAKSKEFTQSHRGRLADPRVVSGFQTAWKEIVYPIVTVKSSGARLWDVDGNEYVDILNGFGPIMLGHAPQFVTDAVAEQLQQGFEIGPQTPLAGEVAELVCDMTGMERATFCNTGSEAVMAAIRIARTVTGRKKFVLFAGAYHGMFDEVLVKGIRKGGQPHSMPIAPGIPSEAVGHVTVLEYGTAESLEYIRTHAKELAAVLVEPVQSRHPALQPVEFLREVRRITEASETALIFDEVVTGFRVHPGGAQALFNIRADLATYGKVIGGGLPIGILTGGAKFMDALDGGMWQYGDDSFPERGVTFFAGTFVRHPLALAAVKAVLLHFKKAGPKLQEDLSEKTAKLAGTLNAFFQERHVPTHIEHFGSIFYFSFPSEQRLGSLLYYHLREKGVHIQEGFPCFLTTAHTDADIEHIVRAFAESIVEMQAGGLLPAPWQPDDFASTSAPHSSTPNVDQTPTEAPLTEAQLEILLSALVSDEASCAFNESFTLRLRGPLHTGALREALQELIARHDAFRSTFDGQTLTQRFRPPAPIDLPIIDISAQTSADRETHLADLIRLDAHQPFDLVHGPPVRVALVQLAADDHALIFTAHHIICDGWSTNILLDELSRLYAAKRSGMKHDLPVASSFRGYAQSQADWTRHPDHAAVEKWWVEKFRVPVIPLELPTDRPRGTLKSYAGNTARRKIDAATTQKIRRFGAQNGCTLFVTLLAAFKATLHRITNQQDIVVGVPAAGQSLLDDASLVGHCVHFLPQRSSIGDETTVKDLMSQVKGTLLDAYEHQNYTYGSLIRALALPRDPSRLPLVEVQFNVDRVGRGLRFPDLECEVDPNPKSFANFDLFLNIGESDRGLLLDCDYNTDLFDESTIIRWLGHFQTVLEAMVTEQCPPILHLPLLTDTEKQQLLTEWNATTAAFPRDKCIHHLIEEQAARTPGAVAAVFEDQEFTYEELNNRGNQLAHYLQKRGVKQETPVAVCVERSLDMLVSVLGVLKSGGAYVPLDPNYPNERIMAVLEDALPAVLLTQSDVASRFGDVPTQIICLDKEWVVIDTQSSRRPETKVTADKTAYLIFTSGSTGRPKGVQVTHRNVVNMLCSMAREPGITARDRLFAVTTISFDIAVLELFLPLTVGARVIIAAADVLADGFKLKAQLVDSGATILQTTPASWRLLLTAGWDETRDLRILCGGEAFPRDLADALVARFSSVWNMYGPTETTVWSAVSSVNAEQGPVAIGHPIANTQFYILDRAGQLAPIGIPGELLIGGEGVARGYWNDPTQTAEKFIKNPFAVNPHSRLYRTGDLVRYLADGRLEFLGRLDTQVKVRGFRIETSEVELAIGQHPDVAESVVVLREDSPGERRLVAYLVARNSKLSTRDLRSFVAAKLPDYMVPSVFVILGSMPRTPNGKVDRRSLPAIADDAVQTEKDYVAPRNAREETLAAISAHVLSLKRISVEDSLFDLGADSLQIFRIVARAVEVGINLTLKQILTHRTVTAICADVDRSGNIARKNGGPQLVAAIRDRYRIRRSQLATID